MLATTPKTLHGCKIELQDKLLILCYTLFEGFECNKNKFCISYLWLSSQGVNLQPTFVVWRQLWSTYILKPLPEMWGFFICKKFAKIMWMKFLLVDLLRYCIGLIDCIFWKPPL